MHEVKEDVMWLRENMAKLLESNSDGFLAVERVRFELDDQEVKFRTARGQRLPQDRLVGEGFSEVWKATYKGMYVAVKIMKDPAAWMDPRKKELFE